MGKRNPNNLQFYSQWNGQTSVMVPAALNLTTGGFIEEAPWGTAEANKVEGYAGFLFPPGLQRGGKLRIWVPSVGRAFGVTNTGGSTMSVRGIELLKYEIPEEEFESGATSERNREWYNSNGAPKGLLNVSSLAFNAPSFISKPNFLDCDLENITECDQCLKFSNDFTQPDREKDDIVIAVEPRTGVNMYARQRLQTNFKLNSVEITPDSIFGPGWTYWPKINDVAYLPVFVLDLNGVVNEQQANTFKNTIIYALDVSDGVGTTFNVLAGGTFCACAFFSYKWLNMQKNAGASTGGDGPISPNDVPSLATDLITSEEASAAHTHVL
jgi:hypothetical protein